MYSLPQVGQVYLIFLAKLQNLDFSAGHESLEVRLFPPDAIPWQEIAFTAIRFTLEKYVDAGLAGQTSAHLGSREKK